MVHSRQAKVVFDLILEKLDSLGLSGLPSMLPAEVPVVMHIGLVYLMVDSN
jgi:hypothetical protein